MIKEKIQTNRKFKSVIKFKPCLDTIENANLGKLLSKFKLRYHDLEIERGRYRKKMNTHRAKKMQNFYSVNLIEDEYHFLMICPTFSNLHNDFLTLLTSIIQTFKNYLTKTNSPNS